MRLPRITTKTQLCKLIEDIGFLPLFRNELEGFSVMDITNETDWFGEKEEYDPWHWREEIAFEGRIAYGKLFNGKAGFISRDWSPVFANYRRNGYDFDALYEDGLASYKHKRIMDLFVDGTSLPSYQIKRGAGFGKDGLKGFEGALTALEMRTYLTVGGFSGMAE